MAETNGVSLAIGRPRKDQGSNSKLCRLGRLGQTRGAAPCLGESGGADWDGAAPAPDSDAGDRVGGDKNPKYIPQSGAGDTDGASRNSPESAMSSCSCPEGAQADPG